MQGELQARRRALEMVYRRYLEADRLWVVAVREARLWFPADRRPPRTIIGEAGSPIRRAFDQRERAVLQLQVAKQMLDDAKRRLDRREARRRRAVLLLGVLDR